MALAMIYNSDIKEKLNKFKLLGFSSEKHASHHINFIVARLSQAARLIESLLHISIIRER